MPRHRWTLEEDKHCCQEYVHYFIINKNSINTSKFAKILKEKLHDITEESIRMKLQNIKYILHELGIEDSLAICPRSNYSKQNKQAMLAALQLYNIS